MGNEKSSGIFLLNLKMEEKKENYFQEVSSGVILKVFLNMCALVFFITGFT